MSESVYSSDEFFFNPTLMRHRKGRVESQTMNAVSENGKSEDYSLRPCVCV